MDSISVLHCADLHLGASFSSLPPAAATERSNDLKRAFMKIIDLCHTQKIQLLLISGDLFDSVHVPEGLSDMVRNAFNTINSTYVAIAPGNHDPAMYDSIYRNEDYWPKNVHIFTGKLSYTELPLINVRLWGAGFTNIYQDEPLLAISRRIDNDFINICVVHSDLIQTGGTSSYSPITASIIGSSCMDYIALGHVHKRSEICTAGSVYYAYPGSPEGLGFDEKGERGVYIGKISRGACDLRFYPINKRAYMDIQIDATGLQRQEIIKLIQDSIQKDKIRSNNNLVRIIMTGTVTEDNYISPEYAASVMSDVFYLSIVDQTELSVNTNSSGHDFTLRNIFIRKMQEKIKQNPDDEALKLALKLGLQAFKEKVNYTYQPRL